MSQHENSTTNFTQTHTHRHTLTQTHRYSHIHTYLNTTTPPHTHNTITRFLKNNTPRVTKRARGGREREVCLVGNNKKGKTQRLVANFPTSLQDSNSSRDLSTDLVRSSVGVSGGRFLKSRDMSASAFAFASAATSFYVCVCVCVCVCLV